MISLLFFSKNTLFCASDLMLSAMIGCYFCMVGSGAMPVSVNIIWSALHGSNKVSSCTVPCRILFPIVSMVVMNWANSDWHWASTTF